MIHVRGRSPGKWTPGRSSWQCNTTLWRTYVDAYAGNVTVCDYAQVWLGRQVRRPATVDVHTSYSTHVTPIWVPDGYATSGRATFKRGSTAGRWCCRPRRCTRCTGSSERSSRRRQDRLIPSSPCVGVKLPKTAIRSSFEPPGRRLATPSTALRGLVIAGAALGMRQGELLGLTTDRIDFLRRTVRVDRQMVTIAGPRSWAREDVRGFRTIPAPQVALDALAAHRSVPGRRGCLLFTTDDGQALTRPGSGTSGGKRQRKPGSKCRVPPAPHCRYPAYRRGSVGPGGRPLSRSLPAVCLKVYAHLWGNDEDRIRAAMDEGSPTTEANAVRIRSL